MALRPTSCKEAIAWFEKENGTKASDAKIVELRFQWPPLKKMDDALSTLLSCEKLNMSSNMIDKISGIANMKNLKILRLDHNYIKSLDGVETVADTLAELYISYNCIKMLKRIDTLKKLEILHISNNNIEVWPEFNRLQKCPALRELVFTGNPIVETESANDWRSQVANRLQQVLMLDGVPLIRE